MIVASFVCKGSPGASRQLPYPLALRLHGRYSREQILVAFGVSTLAKSGSSREGVLWVKEKNTELLFVTLNKESKRFSPSTLYHDYFISEELFHWQSQNATSPESEKGQSYIEHELRGKQVLLFVREATRDEQGLTMAFVFCGKLRYLRHSGRKPMSIVWRLLEPPPALTPGLAAALGRIPSGLFIVTWRAGDADRGMLASWVMQAGFEPPMVSVAVGTSRDLLGVVRAGGAFAVNVLADSQRSLLARFGKPPADGEDPFAGLALDRTPAGLAVFAESAAWMECRAAGEAAAAGADHVLVLGRIGAAGGRPETAPIVHLRRSGLRY